MRSAVGLLIAAVVVASRGAAASLDQPIKQVRARHSIGVVAYSAYSRVADFHTGLLYYVPIIVGWLVLIPAAAIVGLGERGWSGEGAGALAAMIVGLVAHMLVTALRAAPILLSQRKIRPDDEQALTAVFDRFQRWHLVRVLIDVGTLAAAVWALVAMVSSCE